LIKGPNQLDERVPIEVDGIQVNFYKNTQCPNFGIPASTKSQPRGKGSAERGIDTYNVVGLNKPVIVGKLLTSLVSSIILWKWARTNKHRLCS
jgi:hypothetical protein